MQPEFYTLYSVAKVRIFLYKSSAFITDVSTMIVISDQTGFSDGLPKCRRDIIASVGQAKKKFLSQKSGFLWIKSCGKCG